MRFAFVPAACGLAAAVLLVSSPHLSASDQRPTDRAADQATAERIEALVRDLGSDQFGVRERASRDLVEMGIVTRAALERAVTSPDAEVRVRAREILTTVSETDFQERLEAFSADYDGRQHRTLPAWDQFSAQFGASRLARELFVEMQRAEPDLLAAMAAGPQPATEGLAKRAQDMIDGTSEVNLGLGTVASFLFVATSEGVKVNEHGAIQLLPYVVQLTYQRHNKSPLWSPLLKKLVGRWLVKDTTSATAFTNLLMASQLELKPESLTVAGRILSSDAMQPNARQVALMAIGRWGDRSHVGLIEKSLDDAARCELGGQPTQIPGKPQGEVQIRDLALAVLLHLTDQDPRDYGSSTSNAQVPLGFPLRTLSFPDDAARAVAHKKWAAWRAAHPDS
jgi:hypothetical protein